MPRIIVRQKPDTICPDATVENSDASYTDTVASGGALVLPDTDIEVNGVNEGSVPSVSTIDFQLTDGVNPVTPDSVTVVGNVVTAQVPSASCPDYDAELFITVTGITDATEQGAIRTLVSDLKTSGLWEKMAAVYPFVGGTATRHSYNLRNIGIFQISFSGGWTHDSNGITGNGTNSIANIGVQTGSIHQVQGGSFSIYNRTNNAGAYYDVANTASGEFISLKWTDDNIYINAGSAVYNPINNPDPTGLWLMEWNATNIRAYRNGTLFQDRTKTVSSIQIASNYFISPTFNPSNRNYAFAAFFNKVLLSSTEITDFYTIVQAFQTTLGRQV
jgi:hypothetical protein